MKQNIISLILYHEKLLLFFNTFYRIFLLILLFFYCFYSGNKIISFFLPSFVLTFILFCFLSRNKIIKKEDKLFLTQRVIRLFLNGAGKYVLGAGLITGGSVVTIDTLIRTQSRGDYQRLADYFERL